MKYLIVIIKIQKEKPLQPLQRVFLLVCLALFVFPISTSCTRNANTSSSKETKLVEEEAQNIKDFKNFQVTYCRESKGIYSYHIIQYKEKTYDPMVILAYRKSSLDSMLWLGSEGYLDYSISDLKSDSKFFHSMKEAWDIEETKNVQIKDGKIIDNGRELPIEDNNGDEYNCHDKDKLVIYKFVNTIVLPPTTINNEKTMEDDIPV